MITGILISIAWTDPRATRSDPASSDPSIYARLLVSSSPTLFRPCPEQLAMAVVTEEAATGGRVRKRLIAYDARKAW
jgi:hypothetical protein